MSEYQIAEKIPRFKDIKKRPDNLIIVDNKFRELYCIPPHIRYIVLDYSLDTSPKNLIEKSERGYQARDTLFFHIPWAFGEKTKSNIKYQIPRHVPYSKNIRVLPEKEFFTFFKFTKEEKKLFKDYIWDLFRNEKRQKSLLDIFEE